MPRAKVHKTHPHSTRTRLTDVEESQGRLPDAAYHARKLTKKEIKALYPAERLKALVQEATYNRRHGTPTMPRGMCQP